MLKHRRLILLPGFSPPEPGSTLPTPWSARHAEAACAHNANSGQTLSNTGALTHAPTGGRHTRSTVPHSQLRHFMAGDRRCTRPVALHQGPCRALACNPRRPGLRARRLQQCAIPNPHPTSVCTPCSACEEAAIAKLICSPGSLRRVHAKRPEGKSWAAKLSLLGQSCRSQTTEYDDGLGKLASRTKAGAGQGRGLQKARATKNCLVLTPEPLHLRAQPTP